MCWTNTMKDRTPRSHIIRQLRILWLRSRERSTALKNAAYKCERCGVKKSSKKGAEQKIEVHHKKGIGNWDEVINKIYKEILCSPDELMVLCPDCHADADAAVAADAEQ